MYYTFAGIFTVQNLMIIFIFLFLCHAYLFNAKGTFLRICDQSLYPFGFWLCHLQESAHISSMPYSASQPSSFFAFSGAQ